MAAKKKRPANRSIKAAATILENIGVVLTSAQQYANKEGDKMIQVRSPINQSGF